MVKVYFSPILKVMVVLSTLWSVSLFLAPATLPPGTVEHLHGTSRIDYWDKWAGLPPYQHIVYLIGDANCHQWENRSYYINENQMPVCARCMALFVFGNIGLITAGFLRPTPSLSETVAGLLPEKLRKSVAGYEMLFLWMLFILCALPTAIDGFVQLLTPYESTNLKRVVFSIPTGWAAGLVIGVIFNMTMLTVRGGYYED